jgi:F0F1-type ATP synthase assembly protein I
MAEKVKLSPEELQKRIKEVRDLAEKSKLEIEEMLRKRPLESAGVVFIAGIVIGILIGVSLSRRS